MERTVFESSQTQSLETEAGRLRPMAAERTSHELTGPELVAIECPLQLKADQHAGRHPPPSRSAYDGLIDRLGGPALLSSQLGARNPNRPVELTLVKSPSNEFVRPIPGEWVQTSNILVKLTKRTRKPKGPPLAGSSSEDPGEPTQLYKIEPVGTIPVTVRFRALADYQYTPDLKHPINKLARDMRSLNCEGVLKFRFEPETEDYSSAKIGLFPPPLFSRYLVPQLYNYRQNIPTVVTEAPDGSQRLINRSRYVPMGPQTITYDRADVPLGPLARDLEQKVPKNELLYQKLSSLFDQRPVWARMAFQHFLSPSELRYVRQNKVILAHHCYLFSDGPFRDLLIKFGYDPRIIPEARFYQRISLRNVDRKDAKDKFTLKLMKRTNPKPDTPESPTADTLCFDGLELHQTVGTYQLCDITDPLLASLINSTKGVLPKCNVRTGWYTSNAIEQIRSILRRKFHGLLDEQRVVKDIECVDLLEIDVSQEAVDLLKKSSPAHRRVKGAAQSADSQLDQAPDVDHEGAADGELDSAGAQTSGSSRHRKPAGSKPHPPNPLLKHRRERQRVKAKAIKKQVSFTEPSQRDVRMVGSRAPCVSAASAGGSTTDRMDIDEPEQEPRSDGYGEAEGDDAEEEEAEEDDEEDFFEDEDVDEDEEEEEDDESLDDGEGHEDEEDDALLQDRSSSLSELSD
ncbi:hypothetical protein PCANC_05261 [Puccinia coronata f. sp. avenae]|uniref:Transcription factor IIIC subunit 5 HTH domain-containing protein n=1 Tax=Puccinia coronata f. sp. avenae TaxID=200324 RepID=A0A2N5VYP5_9BASI|nr:hypothetical protein PCANC_05261 [Puccinia coronata f. sp. avenae]